MKNKIEVLPKDFVISTKYNNNPLWKKYIKWLNDYLMGKGHTLQLKGYSKLTYYGIINGLVDIITNKQDIAELSIYQWYAAINNVPDFTVKGTKLPDMVNSNYCTVNIPQFIAFTNLQVCSSYALLYSIDIITIDDEICISAEKLDYTDDNPFVFKLDDIIKRYKKQNTMKTNKKLIGYKIKEKYVDAYVKLFDSNYSYKRLLQDILTFGISTTRYNNVKSLNLLDIWFDKVYEEDIKLPTINGYKGKYDKENHIFEYGCAKFPNVKGIYGSIKFFNSLSNNTIDCNRTIEYVTLSSGVKISVKELEKLTNYILQH